MKLKLSLFTGVLLCAVGLFGQANQNNFNNSGASTSSVLNAVNVINVKSAPYNAVGNAQSVQDATSASTTGVVTSATANFQPTDVGKKIYCTRSDNSTTVFTPAVTMIASYQSATQVTAAVNGAANLSGNVCVWATQDDTAAIVAAVAAASTPTASYDPSSTRQSLVPAPHTVYLPEGGYLVTSQFFNASGAASNALCPSLIGQDWTKTIIYIPGSGFTSPGTSNANLINYSNCNGIKLGDFTINGLFAVPGNIAANEDNILLNSIREFLIENLEVQNLGGRNNAATLDIGNSQSGIVRNIWIQGSSSAGNTQYQALYHNAIGILTEGFLFSNNTGTTGINLGVNNSAGGTPAAGHLSFVGGVVDECGSSTACTIINFSSNVDISDTTIWAGHLEADGGLWVTGTSQLRANNISVGEYNNTANQNGMQVDSGSIAYLSMSNIWGVGTGVALVNNGTVQDVGGNIWQHCSNTTCSAATLAQSYSGTAPLSSLTHSANTFFLGGTFGAATFGNQTPDQNIIITKIQAISTTSTTCVTAPVVTFANGTNTATLTLTTGKTQWDSAVDSSTGLPVQFISGTAFTAAVSAGSCVTPPTNLNVTYTWQSNTAP